MRRSTSAQPIKQTLLQRYLPPAGTSTPKSIRGNDLRAMIDDEENWEQPEEVHFATEEREKGSKDKTEREQIDLNSIAIDLDLAPFDPEPPPRLGDNLPHKVVSIHDLGSLEIRLQQQPSVEPKQPSLEDVFGTYRPKAKRRGRRCQNPKCNEPLKLNRRADAIYCCELCRSAADFSRKKAAKALTAEQQKDGAIRVLEQFTAKDTISTALNSQATLDGIGVRFATASTNSIIAVETQPGAFDQARAMLANFPFLSQKEADPDWRENWKLVPAQKAEAYALLDAKKIKTEASVVLSKHAGSSLIAKEMEKEFGEAVERGSNVILLHADPDYILRRNAAARYRNETGQFLGLSGFRCRCDGLFGGRSTECQACGGDTAIPDQPNGFPHPRGFYG